MKRYSKVFVYYFTGTGNALNTAIWIENTASKMNLLCSKIDINTYNSLPVKPLDSDSLIVFVSPVHGFNYPPVMLGFISRFPKGSNDVVLMNTRAGMLIKNWVTPGLSGITFYLASLIFLLKGYSVTGMCGIDMPSNWISVHPGLNNRTVLFIHKKMKEKVSSFAEIILSGKKSYPALKEIIQDLFISPVAVLYYFIGRFVLAKTYYASDKCNGCEICVKKCPVNALQIYSGKPFWKLTCESCMRCMSNCPEKAIETGHGFIALVSVTFQLFVSLVLNYILTDYISGLNYFLYDWVFRSLLFILFLAVSYRVMHFLKRFIWFNKLMVYTSLTFYKFWGKRYKAIKGY